MVETTANFANQIANSAVFFAKAHDAGRAGVDAELVFDARRLHVIARAQGSVGIDEEFGDKKQRNAARSGGGIGQAGEHQMNDVGRHLVVAIGDVDLGAENPGTAVSLRNRFRLQRAKISARMGLRQVHGAGPFTGDHFGQVALFQFGAAGCSECIDGALREQGAQAEGEIGAAPDFDSAGSQHMGQRLAAEVFRSRERRPAAVNEGFIGGGPAGWRDDGVAVQAGRAFVASLIEGSEFVFGKLRRAL